MRATVLLFQVLMLVAWSLASALRLVALTATCALLCCLYTAANFFQFWNLFPILDRLLCWRDLSNKVNFLFKAYQKNRCDVQTCTGQPTYMCAIVTNYVDVWNRSEFRRILIWFRCSASPRYGKLLICTYGFSYAKPRFKDGKCPKIHSWYRMNAVLMSWEYVLKGTWQDVNKVSPLPRCRTR